MNDSVVVGTCPLTVAAITSAIKTVVTTITQENALVRTVDAIATTGVIAAARMAV